MSSDPVNVFEAMGEWGYCRYCDRLELLTDDGKLSEHNGAMSSANCVGNGTDPTEPPAEREKYGPEPLTPSPVHPKGDGDDQG